MFEKNGFKGDAKTAEGRITQLANVAVLKFQDPKKVQDFLGTPDKKFGNKTPQEAAAESVDGMIKAIKHLRDMEP